jgi:hypothetical protein
MAEKAATQPSATTFKDRVVLFILWLLSVGGLGLFGFMLHLSSRELWRLHGILSTFRPTTATAISARSAPEPWSVRSRDRFAFVKEAIFGPDHEVWVSYSYVVDGARNISGTEEPKEGQQKGLIVRVQGAWSGQVGLPGPSGRRSLSGSASWARDVVEAHAPGEQCTAYYDPENPAQSFLLREPDFSPYLGALIALMLSCMFGLFALAPLLWLLAWVLWALGRYSEEARWPGALWAGLWCAAYLIGGGMILGHYFLYSDQPFGRSLAPVVGMLFYVLPPAALGYYFFGPELGRASSPTQGGKNTTEEKRAQRKQEREAKKRNRSKKK